MARRRLALLAAVVSLFLLLATTLVWRWATIPEPGVTLANFKRLHAGMTMDQVEAIFGQPPDRSKISPNEGRVYTWLGDEGTASIAIGFPGGGGHFRQGETVCQLAPAPESPFAHIRRWFGL